jgi:uncharacterized membrane protein
VAFLAVAAVLAAAALREIGNGYDYNNAQKFYIWRNQIMSVKFIKRIFRHLFVWPGIVQKQLPVQAMLNIEAAIAKSESLHLGEICFVVEANLHVLDILGGKSARTRAIETFSTFKVWDTEHNNGVLIYLLLADHDFEILADRGIHLRVGATGWEVICKGMEARFRQGQFEAGILEGIQKISEQLEQHYPSQGKKPNELKNSPIII